VSSPEQAIATLATKTEANCTAGSKQPVRLAGGWCWFVLREKYCWLIADGWFLLREKYCWLVADKPSEHGENCKLSNSSSDVAPHSHRNELSPVTLSTAT
jgi:hypothetical protein